MRFFGREAKWAILYGVDFLNSQKKKQLSSEERRREIHFGQKNAYADQINQQICSVFFFCADFSFPLEVLILRIRIYKL